MYTISLTTHTENSTHTHTHTHTFNGLFSRTTWVSQDPKGKPFWILLKQEMMGWQWHQLDHMQIICTTLQTIMPGPHHLILRAGCSSLRPTNSVKAVKAENNTENNNNNNDINKCIGPQREGSKCMLAALVCINIKKTTDLRLPLFNTTADMS